jgi:hypothetical protein
MEKRIEITENESNEIYALFAEYNAYLSILSYFSDQGSTDTESHTFDRKWAEAVDLHKRLEAKKHQIELKYKPEGEWARFSFDFDNHMVVFMHA